jgi:lectin family protein
MERRIVSSSRFSRTARGGLLAAFAFSIVVTAPVPAFAAAADTPINYPSFSGAEASLSLNGTASVARAGSRKRVLRLTSDGFRQAGSAWATEKIDVTRSFETRFKAYLHHSQPDADGIAFLIQGVGPRALGGWGGGIGYRGIEASVAVEFDTYQNPTDPSENHLAVVLAGDPDTHLVAAESGVPLAGRPFAARVAYDAPTRNLKVYVTSLRAGSTEQLMIDQTVDLAGDVGASTAWVGFTGATGNVTSSQDIYSWTLEAPDA